MKIIAVTNQKGGVGKTTTVANLSAALALQGKQVLTIDLDPQAHLTTHLGFQPEDFKWTICNALLQRPSEPFGGYDPLQIITHEVNPALSLIPSNLELSSAEIEMAGMMGREALLSDLLRPIRRDYDFILIDCPPTLGLLCMNALAAANEVVIPFQTEYFATKGIQQLLDVLSLVRKRRINPSLQVAGFVGCLYDGRKNLHKEVVESVRQNFGDQVFRTLIRSNVALAESSRQGVPIFEYAPKSPGADDYQQLAEELLFRR